MTTKHLGIAMIIGLLSLTNTANAETNQAEIREFLTDAENTVTHYRALRRICANTEGSTRQACIAELSEKTEGYRLAKAALEANNAKGTSLAGLIN